MNMPATQNQTSMLCLIEVRPENSTRTRFYATAIPSGDYVDITGFERSLTQLPRGKHLVRLDVSIHVDASHLEPLEAQMEEEF